MLFDLYTNYNLVSGKQYKQKLRPQNSQKKGYMYCLINKEIEVRADSRNIFCQLVICLVG